MILKKISFLLFIFFIGYLSLHADNFPQKSIDGKGFYLYKVSRAEGFYSICKKFESTSYGNSGVPVSVPYSAMTRPTPMAIQKNTRIASIMRTDPEI